MQLARYIENVENAPQGGIDSPISLALDLQTLRASSDPQQASLANIVERMTAVQGAVSSIESMDNRLTHRIDQLLRIVVDLKDHAGRRETAGAVSDLSESIEGLRTKLVKAVTSILDEIQEQHSELAKTIKSVFEEQSKAATDSVERSFAAEIAITIPDASNCERLLERLVEVFMHGMASMGSFQHINVTEQTEASTNAIRERISKSIEDVFRGIDKIEEQVIALPPMLSAADTGAVG